MINFDRLEQEEQKKDVNPMLLGTEQKKLGMSARTGQYSILSVMREKKFRSDMNVLYQRARHSITTKGYLRIHNIKDLVNTIIRRKPLKIPGYVVLIDLFLSLCPCLGSKRLMSRKIYRKRRQFTRSKRLLDQGFDVTNLLKTINLTNMMLSSGFTRE